MMNNIPPNRSNKNTQLIIACCLSFISFVIFLVKTGIVQNSIVMSLLLYFLYILLEKIAKLLTIYLFAY